MPQAEQLEDRISCYETLMKLILSDNFVREVSFKRFGLLSKAGVGQRS